MKLTQADTTEPAEEKETEEAPEPPQTEPATEDA
jgi:hypothetical protein